MYRKAFLRWVDHFTGLSNITADKNDIGLAQFYEHQSNGIAPVNPDPFYLRLVNGKKWFDWTVDEIHKSYGTSEWYGWDYYRNSIPEWLWSSVFGWSKGQSHFANPEVDDTRSGV